MFRFNDLVGRRPEEKDRQYGSHGKGNQKEEENGEDDTGRRAANPLNSSEPAEHQSNNKSEHRRPDITAEQAAVPYEQRPRVQGRLREKPGLWISRLGEYE